VKNADPVVVLKCHQKSFHKGVELHTVFGRETGNFLDGQTDEHEFAYPPLADASKGAAL
jgi:hypothetical protein